MKEVKIIHFHPETKKNKGDIAIAQSIEDLLRENLNVKKYTHGFIEHLKEREYPRLIDMLSKSKKTARIFPNFYPFKLFYKKLRKRQIKNILKKINNHDLFIIGGGGIYSNFFFPLDNKILSKIKIPIVIFSPGVNINIGSQSLTRETKESIKDLNKIARLSSVRDSDTLDILKNELKEGVVNIGCPALLLKEKPSKKITVDKERFNLGINIASHVSSLDKERIRNIMDLYLKVIKKLSSDKEISVYYFQHHPKEKWIIKRLQKEILNLNIISMPPKEMKYYYSKMNLVISMMLHSCILAFGSGVKLLNIAYNQKNIAFMKDINKEDCLIKIDEANDSDKVYKKISTIILDNKHINKTKFERRIKDFLTEIKEIN